MMMIDPRGQHQRKKSVEDHDPGVGAKEEARAVDR
jgi:hypothetical protein